MRCDVHILKFTIWNKKLTSVEKFQEVSFCFIKGFITSPGTALAMSWKGTPPNSLQIHLVDSPVVFKASVLLGCVKVSLNGGEIQKCSSKLQQFRRVVLVAASVLLSKKIKTWACGSSQNMMLLAFAENCPQGRNVSWKTTMSGASGMWPAQGADMLVPSVGLIIPPPNPFLWPWTSRASM